MKTDTPPQDYNRRIVIKPQKIKLCDECLANMTYSDTYRCVACRNTSYVIVYEDEAAKFRLDVADAREAKDIIEWEVAAAIYRIDETEEEIDAFLALTTLPEYQGTFYLDEPTDDELREIEGEQAFIGKLFAPAPSDSVSLEIDSMLMQADLGTHSHLTIKVMPHTYNFRHGGTHPLSDVLTAYTWCSDCGEILSLDNDAARAAMCGEMPELDAKPGANEEEMPF